ncbi:MAG: GH1 family beta-glucosidase [Spirochaetota bacterium]
MSRLEFPKSFLWGTATSAYQIEGAHTADGKGASIWDAFSARKGKIKNGDVGDVTCNHYYQYKEDIALMKSLGFPSYRFSVSWPRIFPEGKGKVNEKGIAFYEDLVDTLLENGIEPFLTLFHWDLPLATHERGGWYDRQSCYEFAEYANLMVRRLGDRVKNWITLNEPWIVLITGYVLGIHAPGYIRPFSSLKVAHNLLLAHGKALQSMRQENSQIKIGITNALSPVDYYRVDKSHKAAERAHALINTLWMDPIFKGKYPEELVKQVETQNKGNLHTDDLKLISGKTDFLGVNHYTRTIVRWLPFPLYAFRPVVPSYEGVTITSMNWEVYPQGLYRLLKWIQKEYDNPPVYITENGASFFEKPAAIGQIEDKYRISFYQDYLMHVHRAIQEECDVRGYFAWSFLDNLEWHFGFEKTFGLVAVDRTDSTFKRHPKKSAHWYGNTCRENGFAYEFAG